MIFGYTNNEANVCVLWCGARARVDGKVGKMKTATVREGCRGCWLRTVGLAGGLLKREVERDDLAVGEVMLDALQRADASVDGDAEHAREGQLDADPELVVPDADADLALLDRNPAEELLLDRKACRFVEVVADVVPLHGGYDVLTADFVHGRDLVGFGLYALQARRELLEGLHLGAEGRIRVESWFWRAAVGELDEKDEHGYLLSFVEVVGCSGRFGFCWPFCPIRGNLRR